jgi:hypothetical protein
MSDVIERTESAPLLLVFGVHASLMGRLLRVHPTLLQRITYAPRRAIHAIGAYLHLVSLTSRSDQDLACTLDETHPRDLLRTAIPDAPPRLYRALERAGDRVKGRRFYERLSALCRTPLANQLLDGDLHEMRLSRAEMVLTLDPSLARIPNILRISQHNVEALSVLIGFLRAQGTFRQSDLQLPPEAGISGIVGRLLRSLDNVAAPSVAFDVLPPFHLIRSVGELRRTGSELKNCIGQMERFSTPHWMSLASGDALYVTRSEPPLLACVRRCGDDLWYLSEVAGLDNGKIDEDARLALVSALRASGISLLPDDPARALSILMAHD